MKIKKVLFFLILFISCISCSKDKTKVTIIKEKSLDLQVQETYLEGKEALEKGDVLYAAKKFNETEILYPQSIWAPRSALMAAYSYYIQDYYGDAIAELERFLKVYPQSKNIDYVNYLLAICYYEQIVDEKKDLQSILNAKKTFIKIIDEYPKTEYAYDAKFKIDYINNILAAKEMYIGRYYVEKKKWIPAINRFKNVVEEYDTTIYIEEALYRLVEIYFLLGLKEQSKKYANLLGYNYQSSMWYENSYALFNKKYQKLNLNEKDKKNSLRKKIKLLLNLDE